jgi:hypothetical protein
MGISHCLVVVVMTVGIAKGPARVMTRRAFVVMGADESDAGSGNGGERLDDGDGRQIVAPRRHSDRGKSPFRCNGAGKGLFVRTGVECA